MYPWKNAIQLKSTSKCRRLKNSFMQSKSIFLPCRPIMLSNASLLFSSERVWLCCMTNSSWFVDWILQVMWSSCPRKYIWSMWCYDWSTSGTHCPIGSVMLGLFISQTNLDDLPMDDIVRDLCPTGIKVGASDFKWFYSFGENSKYIRYDTMNRTFGFKLH